MSNGHKNSKVGELEASPKNPRKITDENLENLGRSMKEFGDLGGVVFNRRTGRVVGGHQRIKNLDPEWKIDRNEIEDETGTVAVGYIETPWGVIGYREVDWDEKKEIAGNIAANKHGGEWDLVGLKDLLVELNASDFDLNLTGFGEAELKSLIDYEGKLFAPGTEEDQGALDRKSPIVCPRCGNEFTT